MGTILGGLQLADDGNDDIIADTLGVDLGGDGEDGIHGRGGWRVLPGRPSGRRTMMLIVAVLMSLAGGVLSQLGIWREGGVGVVRPLDFLGGLIILILVRLGEGGRATRGRG